MKFKHLLFFLFTTFSFGSFSQCVEIVTEPAQDVFCPGDEVTLVATEGFDAYNWYYNFQDNTEEGVLFETTTENSITLGAAEWAVSYWYVVADDAVCTDPSPTVVWDSWVFAPIAIAHDFPTAFCPGDSSLIESAFNGPVNFQWFMDFAPIPGANESTYWVTEPGYYTLQASYPECPDYWLNSGLGPEFSIYTPQTPEISLEMVDGISQLSVTDISDVQWYLAGEAIDGATGLVLVPEEDGVYTVTGVDDNGCEVESDPFTFTSLGLGDLDLGELATIYPNPAREQVTISLKEGTIEAVRIYDLTGKVVLAPAIKAAKEFVQFDLENLSPGSYLVRTATTDGKMASSHLVITE